MFESLESEEIPEELPLTNPVDYPPLPIQEEPLPAPVSISDNPPGSTNIYHDAAHRWTAEKGFKPLTRKDFPRWIDDVGIKNPIARKYPMKRKALYKKRMNMGGWKNTHQTMPILGAVSSKQLGMKTIPIEMKKGARKYFTTSGMNW